MSLTALKMVFEAGERKNCPAIVVHHVELWAVTQCSCRSFSASLESSTLACMACVAGLVGQAG